MPTLNSLRKRIDEQLTSPALMENTCEMLVSDPRARLTPKQVVESKFYHALARMERREMDRKPERE